MRAVLLAGGLGTRLAEETSLRPKPMVEVGGFPILWHIMKIYSSHGINEFVICLGYKGYYIKEFFANYALHQSSVCVDVKEKSISYIGEDNLPPWKIFLVDTGAETMTGGRLKRVRDYLPDDEPFCMTYGDGVADIDIGALVKFHKDQGLEATLTAVRPAGRFGATMLEGAKVTQFTEKPAGDGAQINGGFFVLDPKVIDRIADDATIWEREPLEGLARDGQLAAFEHNGFWQPMDTLRDKIYLDKLWTDGQAPWKVW
ncbi:MAG TPA: glucose-1-phosphate cytidylyltransferase [Caulobacter sp.]|nr:glucose-1-phosphate cytidylyltransferase [Caulobacter sp.]